MTISTSSSLSFTPMMCAQMLRLQKKQRKWFVTFYKPIERALDGLDNWYQKRLNWACLLYTSEILLKKEARREAYAGLFPEASLVGSYSRAIKKLNRL